MVSFHPYEVKTIPIESGSNHWESKNEGCFHEKSSLIYRHAWSSHMRDKKVLPLNTIIQPPFAPKSEMDGVCGGYILNLLILLFAHLLADYPLQGEFLATMKGKNIIILFSHAGIWTGTILTALHLMGYSVNLIDVATLFIVHAIADYAKAKPLGFYKKLDSLKGGLLIDQGIHLVQLIVLLVYKSI